MCFMHKANCGVLFMVSLIAVVAADAACSRAACKPCTQGQALAKLFLLMLEADKARESPSSA